mmetsp:Transcript_1679/g.2400  ORF Transcript_1679/g.2400 Transcript_1679/m.2400 type:complete len:138 (-) Transcript_1679:350-763(-)
MRLVKKLILHIAIPRTGIHKLFNADNKRQISKVIFFSTLRSLDEMAEIRQLNFKNLPLVSSELVELLATNSEFDAIKVLQEKNRTLKAELVQAKKDVASLTKACQTATNKVNDLKNVVSSVQKRLKPLEDKKNTNAS